MEQLLSEALMRNDIQTPALRKLAGRGLHAIYGFPIHVEDEAINLWLRLRAIRNAIGYWPIFLGGSNDVRILDHRLEHQTENNIQEILTSAYAFNLDEWLQVSALAMLRNFFSFKPYPEKWMAFGEFPSVGVHSSLVHIGFLKIHESWASPALLAFGGWTDNPKAHVHCALMRRWNQLFGADVLSITKDEVSFIIQNPPRDKITAHSIRSEIFLYCPDRHSSEIQWDTGFYEEIINRKYWYFRWSYPWNNDISILHPPEDHKGDGDNHSLMYPN